MFTILSHKLIECSLCLNVGYWLKLHRTQYHHKTKFQIKFHNVTPLTVKPIVTCCRQGQSFKQLSEKDCFDFDEIMQKSIYKKKNSYFVQEVFLPSPLGTHNASSPKKKKKVHMMQLQGPQKRERERETLFKMSLMANFWCKLLLGYIK